MESGLRVELMGSRLHCDKCVIASPALNAKLSQSAKSQPCRIARKKGRSGIGCDREYADFGVYALLHFNVTEHAVIEMSANVANHQVNTRF